jgi:MSHA biogenesis protein MshI
MSWFIKKKRQPGWLALRLQQEQVDLVHIRRGPTGRAEVALCDSYRTEATNVATLARLRKELKLDQYRCTTLLAPEQYQLHQIDAPNVPPAEMKTAVRWRVKDVIEYPLEAATIDAIDIPPDGDASAQGRQVYAVTARTRSIESCVQPFKEAHLDLAAIDIPDLAQRNVAALFEPAQGGVAMLGFYPHDAILTFTRGGELYLSRRIDISLAQLMSADEQQRKDHFERIAVALQRSFDHFERQYPHVPLTKLLLGPLPEDIGLKKHLASNVHLAVETIELSSVLDFPAIPELKTPERQAHHLLAIGAALRDERDSPA